MKQRKKSVSRAISLQIALFFLLLSCGCASMPVPSTTPTSAPTREATKGVRVTKTSGSLLTTAFPPAGPLVCPRSKTEEPSFVKATTNEFLSQGKSLRLYGFTFYPVLIGGASAWHRSTFSQYIDWVLDTGQQIGQNIVRPTDFWDKHYHDNPQEDRIVWQNVDYLVCEATYRHMFIEMDISAFAWFLISQGQNQYDITNWTAFLDAIGKRYTNQPAIAFYSIAGEPVPPKNSEEMAQMVAFYRTATNALYTSDAGHHLIAAGGFNHMAEETPQTQWWQAIYSLPHNDIVAFKTYSQKDIELIPQITAFAKQIGKPSLDEEFGLPQELGDQVYTGEIYNNIQSSRAQFYDTIYTLGEQYNVAGFIFWNMGCQLQKSGYDVSIKTPAVWNVIQAHAPRIPTNPEKSLCI